jgi:hypothetical protein
MTIDCMFSINITRKDIFLFHSLVLNTLYDLYYYNVYFDYFYLDQKKYYYCFFQLAIYIVIVFSPTVLQNTLYDILHITIIH